MSHFSVFTVIWKRVLYYIIIFYMVDNHNKNICSSKWASFIWRKLTSTSLYLWILTGCGHRCRNLDRQVTPLFHFSFICEQDSDIDEATHCTHFSGWEPWPDLEVIIFITNSLPLVLHLLKGTELIETSVSIQIMTFKPGQIRFDISELCNWKA